MTIASAPAVIVEKAQPVARRNRDQRLAGSRSQPWVMVSKPAAPRPLPGGDSEAAGFPVVRRPIPPSRPVPWAVATTLSASPYGRVDAEAGLMPRPLISVQNRPGTTSSLMSAASRWT